MLVNSRKPASAFDKFKTRVIAFPATELAVEVIGRPIPNTALLAAFLSLTEHVPQKALAAALKGRFSGPVLEKNLALIAKAADAVEKGAWKEKADA